jgi:SpoVK/Ycf46/Vps4 family AAA+-type ATPase
MFSTNLEPEDLMDPAFLRRLPYKIEVGPPNLDNFRTIFKNESEKQGMSLSDEVFHSIVRKLRDEKELDCAAYHAQIHHRPDRGHVPLHGAAVALRAALHRLRAR